MRQLTWFERGTPVTALAIQSLETSFGYRLPPDLVEFAMVNSGASNPEECEFVVTSGSGVEDVSCFGSMLAFDEDGPGTVLSTYRALRCDEQIPVSVLPIVNTGFGDYVCLDYRLDHVPTVAYFAHGKSGEDSLLTLATTFTAFLDLLTVPENE
ncbi:MULTISPECIES: SMI1/KNR4 family protein [Variovorax]|uniref:SMI1/KNR4 family protein n=1 Tax=Variovorax TaxID=34072 RepID=UPI0028563DE1|nr:SMI1/KNR4 family protein [Variovorax sp. 3319]MDR6889364.1 hypothetical protein [Variovorax sp. 3319]